MSELLDWAEKAAIENLRGRRENAEHLLKEGVTSFTILIAAATGALAYVVKGIESHQTWLIYGSAAFAGYLYLLCASLVLRVLRAGSLPALYNEPQNLYQPKYTLNQLREVELQNIQARIVETRIRNETTAGALNRIRLWAIASPLVFAITAYLAEVLPSAQAVAGG